MGLQSKETNGQTCDMSPHCSKVCKIREKLSGACMGIHMLCKYRCKSLLVQQGHWNIAINIDIMLWNKSSGREVQMFLCCLMFQTLAASS